MKKNYPSLLFYILFLGLVINLSKAQQSYTFTSCGATASLGPTQLQVNNAYLSTNLSGQVISNNGIQTWTVPTSGLYRIAAHGAQGGGADGGKGAIIEGDFNLTAGDVLRIVVGQQGITLTSEPNSCGGGGGATVAAAPAWSAGSLAIGRLADGVVQAVPDGAGGLLVVNALAAVPDSIEIQQFTAAGVWNTPVVRATGWRDVRAVAIPGGGVALIGRDSTAWYRAD